MTVSTAAHADTAEFQHLSALYRLLKRAVATRSEREVLRTFVEALAVWQDAESLAYVRDVTGRFVLDVTLPGSDRAAVPPILDALQIAGGVTTLRLPPADREALGFRSPTDVLLSRIRGRASSDWVIVSCSRIDSLAEARLAVYVEAVGQALTEMTAVESSRLTWAMLQHLLPTTDDFESAARGAVDALAAAIDGEISLWVARADGSRVLTIGDVRNSALTSPPTRSPDVLAVPIEVPAPFIAAVSVRRPTACPLAGREEHLLQSAASTLGAWLGMVAPRLPLRNERRAGARSFDQLVHQTARDAQAHEKDLTVLVVLLGPEPPARHVTRACVVQIRGQLRPSDMAGTLSSGHIGVVLPDTPAAGADVVAERLRQLLSGDLGVGPFPQAAVVSASGSARLAVAESQLREAYARVLGDIRLMPGPTH